MKLLLKFFIITKNAKIILTKCYLIKYMKALISNDDGITASGILASKMAVEEICETYVIAPETQQSGIGHALTLYEPLRVNEHTLKDGSKGYGVTGTPTDAVTLALFEIMDERPDIMISGINTGFNIGKAELTTSGTLGAAIEAASFGTPTIAIPQEVTRDDIKFENGENQVDFDFAGKMLNKLVKIVLKKGLPEGIDLLNVNVPANPSDDKFEIANLSERMYIPDIDKRLDPRGKPYYWIGGIPYDSHAPGSDGHTLSELNRTTITPINIDLTGDVKKFKDYLEI